MNALCLDMRLSLSLNCELIDHDRRAAFVLPLAWLTMSLEMWQSRLNSLFNTFKLVGILGRSLAWGLT